MMGTACSPEWEACHPSLSWSLSEDRSGGASEDARLADQPRLRVIEDSGRARPGLACRRRAAWCYLGASVMLARRVPLKVVSDLLGLSSIAITGAIYRRVSPDVARSGPFTSLPVGVRGSSSTKSTLRGTL